MAKPQVNVTEVLYWDCPACYKANYSDGWVRRGDEQRCFNCGTIVQIGEQYCDCRPAKHEGKKFKITAEAK